jgi:hypothetical protein
MVQSLIQDQLGNVLLDFQIIVIGSPIIYVHKPSPIMLGVRGVLKSHISNKNISRKSVRENGFQVDGFGCSSATRSSPNDGPFR